MQVSSIRRICLLVFSWFLSSRVHPFVDARQWQAAIKRTIIHKSDIDSRRYELKLESDPFFFPEDLSPEIDYSTESPGVNEWVTLSPTISPSSIPSDTPSLMPSVWDIEENGGCRSGQELFEVHMYDSWGDGWDQTTLTITGIENQDPNIVLPTSSMTKTVTDQRGDVFISMSRTVELDDQSIFNPKQGNEIDPLGIIFQGGLRQGSHDSVNVCLLPKRCYQVVVAGGEFLNEVSWDIRSGDSNSNEPVGEPILGGGAPAGCTFSLPDEYGHHFCLSTCSGTLPPTVTTEAPKVIGHLQHNAATGSIAISKATGETVSSTFGTKRSPNIYGSETSSILGNFDRVPEEEEDNN